jgi:cell division septum initiation protein DivIVA
MAKRLISLFELDEIEGLVEHHRQLQERIEAVEADAAQFGIPVQGTLELARKAERLKRDLVTLLEKILARVKARNLYGDLAD